VERAWRAVGTGLFLALIGIGGSVLAITVFPLIMLFVRDPDRRRRRIQFVLHRSLVLYCRAIHVMKVADVEMVGTERLRDLRGAMLIANHPSLLDVVMIMAAVPNVQCIVKGGLWKNPFFRLTVTGAGYIRNDLDPEALLQACVDSLKAGNNLIVFPEGTRTVAGRRPKLHRGFAAIALMAEADLQLIRITVDPPLLHKGNPWWNVPASRTKFKMDVGERLDIREFLEYRYRSVSARTLVARIEKYYTGNFEHGSPQPGPGSKETDHFGAEAGGFVT
jgi:1-acyl-sn-glycerol-3-phosphate acyltransferase